MTLLRRPFLTVNGERGGRRTEKSGEMDCGGDGMEDVGEGRGRVFN